MSRRLNRRPSIRAMPQQRGLTLIELMISLTLGLIVVTGIITLFVYTNRNNKQNQLIAGMQDQARFALATLSRDIAMSGYWGGMASAASIVPNTDLGQTSTASVALLPANDCGPDAATSWAFHLTRTLTTTGASPQTTTWPSRIEFRNQDNATAVSGIWNCIGDYKTGTDVVALRRVAGQLTGTLASGAPSVTLRAYNDYLQTNGVVGTMTRWGAAATAAPVSTEVPLSAPMSFYRYFPRIYYVRNYARTVGDGIPTLCRKELCPSGFQAGSDAESGTCGATGAPATANGMYTECLAEGVEDMQIVWGINSNGSTLYTSTPSAQDVAQNAVTAQIFLRVRSSGSDIGYIDTKTYTGGDVAAYTPSTATDPTGTAEALKAKHYYRHVYSTTVYLRNPAR